MLKQANPDHAWIADHIPHQGSMCLLDHVAHWSEQEILCVATSHNQPDNPLRAHGRLGIATGVEYAAQAMAVHGALLAPADSARPKVGYLVSVRGVKMAVDRLDDVQDALEIKAQCLMASESNMLYEFSLEAAGEVLLQGRAAVMLNAEKLAF
jgi:predicted hotdog family 3-hydroxylacyl-ACP dehydratase